MRTTGLVLSKYNIWRGVGTGQLPPGVNPSVLPIAFVAVILVVLTCIGPQQNVLALGPTPNVASPNLTGLTDWRITDIAVDCSSLTIRPEVGTVPQGQVEQISVKDGGLRAKLRNFVVSDLVDLKIFETADGLQLGAIELAAQPTVLADAQITQIAPDFSSLGVTDFESTRRPAQIWKYLVKDQQLQNSVKEFATGDRVSIAADEAGALKAIEPATVVHTTLQQRLVTLVVSAAAIAFLVLTFTGSRLPMLLMGLDGRYSNSKFQMVLWFGVVITTYVATVILRWFASGYDTEFFGGVNFPQNLLLISGFSALTFGGAKGITVSKVQKAQTKAVEEPGATTEDVSRAIEKSKPHLKKGKAPSFFADLSCDDQGNPDLGDLQMVLVAILAVAVYSVQVWHFWGTVTLLKTVTTPDVDSTILATFGLGQGAYLVKKAAGDGA
jgi:hypothetical protein